MNIFKSLLRFDIFLCAQEYVSERLDLINVGEVIDLYLTCPDDNVTEVKVSINVEDIKVKFDKDHTKTVKISEDLWVDLKYPGLDSFMDPQENIDDTFAFVAKSIDKIYNEDDVWDDSTTTPEEFVSFLENMSSKQFNALQKFFETMPALSHEVKIVNPNTKVESSYIIQGLSNFFV